MPQVAICPECSSKLKVPDTMLGKKVKCPRCSLAFVVEAPEEEPAPRPSAAPSRGDIEDETTARKRKPAPPREEEPEEDRPRRRRDEEDDYEEDDRPRRRRGRGKIEDWLKVRSGMLFAVFGFLLYILGYAVVLIALLVMGLGAASAFGQMAQQQRAGQPPELGGAFAGVAGGIILLILSALFSVGGRALEITAFIFCLWAPSRHGAKGLAIAALVLAGLGLLSSCCAFVPMAGSSSGQFNAGGMGGPRGGGGGGSGMGGNPVGGLGGLLYFAQVIVFLFFCRAVAVTFNEDGLARGIVGLIILIGASLVMTCLMICGFVMAFFGVVANFAAKNAQNQGQPSPDELLGNMGALGIIGIILAVILVLVLLAGSIWYIVTLFQVRTAITNYVERRG